jgi:hypothetical protein
VTYEHRHVLHIFRRAAATAHSAVACCVGGIQLSSIILPRAFSGYRRVLECWSDLLDPLLLFFTILYSLLLCAHYCPQSDDFTTVTWWRLSTAHLPPFPGIPNCPRPRLPASNSNSSPRHGPRRKHRPSVGAYFAVFA